MGKIGKIRGEWETLAGNSREIGIGQKLRENFESLSGIRGKFRRN